MLLVSLPVKAEYYDTTLLTLFSKILPRVVALSSLAPEEGKPLNVCIVRQDVDMPAAEQFVMLLERAAQAHTVKSLQTDFDHIDACKDATLVFVFDTPRKTDADTFVKLTNLPAIVAAYDTRLLEQGADVSLFVGRSVMPYLNLKSLRKKDIRLNAQLLRVSKPYGQEPAQ